MNRLASMLAVMVFVPALEACKSECQELCEDFEVDISNIGLEVDCSSEMWKEPNSCGECLDVLESLGLVLSDPETTCAEYY